ncbi:formylglycine-generating enzyme family protein [Terasakiella pusilla]|uniref:formylglycine-generating enzyme family protein n=1 Tax=Terasakiella pusilla TaxID=64973 RepID=UPI003AA81AB8
MELLHFKSMARSLSGLATLLVFLGTSVAQAEDVKPWNEKLYNPQTSEGDVVLPMPCGGAMVFRKVVIPQQSVVDDYKITLGGSDENVGYAESPYVTYIAGAFSGQADEWYYLISKYEVMSAQYDALSDKCPKPVMPGRLPKVNISWMQAMSFAENYSDWLVKNAPDKLPKEDGSYGYLRLPSDVEWEFAARGGINVEKADFQERLFPMEEGLARYAWFQGTKSANGKLQLAGLLKPNPLGLHDVLGNADEMTVNLFQLNKLDRPHGQAGGYSVRGGNYFTSQESMRTSYRVEQSFMTDKGARKSKTTGFRLVLTGPVVTSKERLAEIQKEWERLGSAQPAAPVAKAVKIGEKVSDDPIVELGAIIKEITDDNAKKRLNDVRLAMRSSIQARDLQRSEAAKAALRLGAFLGGKIKGDAIAVQTLGDFIKERKKRQEESGQKDRYLAAREEKLNEERRILDENLSFYAYNVITTADNYEQSLLEKQLKSVSVEAKGRGADTTIPKAALFLQHALFYQRTMQVKKGPWLDDWVKLEIE